MDTSPDVQLRYRAQDDVGGKAAFERFQTKESYFVAVRGPVNTHDDPSKDQAPGASRHGMPKVPSPERKNLSGANISVTHVDRRVVQLADAVRAVEGGSLGLADGGHDLLLHGHSVADDVRHYPPHCHRCRDELCVGTAEKVFARKGNPDTSVQQSAT